MSSRHENKSMVAMDQDFQDGFYFKSKSVMYRLLAVDLKKKNKQ